MAFDLNEYFAKRDGAFEAIPTGDAGEYLTPKQQQVAKASARKTAQLGVDAARKVEIANINKESVIGKLGLDQDSFFGGVIDTAAATIKDGVGLAGGVIAAVPEAYAAAQSIGVTPDEQAQFDLGQSAKPAEGSGLLAFHEYADPASGRTLLLQNYDGDTPVTREQAIATFQAGGQNAALEKSPDIAAAMEAERAAQTAGVPGVDQAKVDRLTSALNARKTAQSIKDATNLDSLVAVDRETGERSSGLQRRVLGDGALSLVDGSVKAVEAAVGLGSLVSGGEAGKLAQENGFDTKETSKILQSWMTPEQQLADKKVAGGDGFLDTLDKALDNPSVIPKNIAESLPSMVAGGAVGKALGAVGVSAGIGGAIGEGTVMAGSQAEQIRQQTEDGRLTLKQSLLAAGTGVMGAAVGVAGNKLAHALKVTDVDEALVSGAVQNAQRSGLSRTALAAGIEGGEEVLQSSGEQIAQNAGLDKPLLDGVGNAAAMGLITGAPLGGVTAAMEHVSEKAQTQQEQKAQVADFEAAVDKADPSPYLDTKSSNYAPDKAVAVLFAASQKADVEPEVQAAHLEQAETIVADLEQSVIEQKSALADATPAGLAQLQIEHDNAVAAGNQPLAAALAQGITDAQAMTPEVKALAEKRVTELETLLKSAQDVTEQFNQLVSPKAADVEATVTAAATDPVAAEKVLTLAINNPSALSQADLTSLINDESNSLSTEQRGYLRQFDAARVARNKLQDQADVHAEVLQGTSENRGLDQYQAQMGQALRQGQTAKAEQLMTELKAFGESHVAKYRTARAAYEQARDTGKPVQLLKTDKGWEINTGTPLAAEALTANGGLEIRGGKFSRPLIQNIQSEAKAIVATYKQFQSAQALPAVKGVAERRSRPLPRGQRESTGANAPTEQKQTEQSAATEPAAAATVEASEQVPVQSPEQVKTEQVSESTVADIQDAPEAATGPTEQGETRSDLDLFQGDKPATVNASNYKTVNLVRQFFKQAKERAEGGLARPLAAVKNFMQSDKTLAEFSPEPTLSTQQQKVLDLFKQASANWGSLMNALLPTKVNAEYSHTKPIEFFMNEAGELEDNVKTAISVAMFGWLNEHARDLVGSPQHITRMMNWDKDKRLTKAVYDAVGHLGVRESLVANDLGQTVLQTLGLKPLETAGANERARIEAGVGQFAIAFMLDQKLIERQMITKGELVKLGAKLEANANWDEVERQAAEQDATKVYFLRVQTADEDVKAIVEASTGSQGILDKVFASGRRPTEPSRTPPEFTQETTQNTDQPIPQNLRDNLNQLTKQPWKVTKDRFDILKALPEELVNAMIGVVPVNEALVHKDNRPGLKAKNDALLRDKQAAFDYLNGLAAEDETMSQELFMEYSVWKHHRVGMTGSVLNPQTSKVHRFLVGMADWQSTIDPNKPAQVKEFLLQVGAGLGIKIDKQGKPASLEQTWDLLNSAEMMEARAAVASALAGDTLSQDQQQAIARAVELGGENLHSFASLVELVKFDQANAQGVPFVSNLMGEVDGVTNGPMLSQILFGTITQEIAEKGGFYAAGASASDYPTWRGQAGHQDFYETLATRLTENLKGSFTYEDLHPIFMVTGDLTVKVDRNIVKRPLTAVNYGSSMHAAIDGMADEFIEKFYKEIEKLAAKEDRALASEQLEDLLSAISALLKEQKQSGLNTSISIEDAMNNVLSTQQEAGLKKAFADTVGVAMEAALEETLGDFLKSRDQFNGYGRLAFDLYNVVYQHMRDSYVAQNLGGSIATNGAGQAIQELNAEQEALIQKRLARMEPIMATAISHRDGKMSDGVKLADSEKSLSDDPAYTGQISLGRAVPNTAGEKPVKTMRFRGFKRVASGPGVSSLVNGVQSTDSGIMTQVYAKQAILNIHDAGGSGINKIGEMAKALNQSTLDNLIAYSPAAAMAETLQRVLEGLSLVMKDNKDTNLADKVNKILGAQHSSAEQLMKEVVEFAARADMGKLMFLSGQEHISQYGLAGHSYAVTEADQAKIDAAVAKVRTELDGKTLYNLRTLDQTLDLKLGEQVQREATAKQNSWGELGDSTYVSDKSLVDFFKDEPLRPAKEVFAQIERSLGTDLQGQYLRKVLKLLARTLDGDFPVEYVTEGTPFDGQDLTSMGSNYAAWFTTAAGNGHGKVFILGQGFKSSNLTAEVLMHELVHASLALEMTNPSTPEAQVHIEELEALLHFVKAHINSSEALKTRFTPAMANIHELVAYGLTDKEFQDQVLRQVQVPGKQATSSFMTAMKKFIDSVAGLLFKDSRLSQHNQAINGLTVLIENASSLFAASKAADHPTIAPPSLTPMASTNPDPLAQIAAMSTQELFEHLAPANASFAGHLRKIQQSIADKLHGPFGVIKDAVMAEAALTPNDRFIQAIASGRLPYSSAAQASGVQLSAQEAFVFEQVEAVTLASIDNTGSTTIAYRELGKLYEEAKAKLTPQDIGQAAYDYVFTAQAAANGKSDYLARFAAMGLAHEGMAKALQFSTKFTSNSLQGLSFWQSVQAIFERLLETFHSKLTHTTPGQVADLKLATLIEQLVGIEAKRRTALSAPQNGMQDIVDTQTRKLNEAVREGAKAIADSKFFKQSSSSAVRALGAVASTVFGDRLEFFVEGMQKLRDQQFKQRPGLVMGLFNEIRGSHAGNLTAHELLRATNNNERLRKHLISDTSQLVLGGFANGGNDLSRAAKKAITQGALRTDMQSLIDHYTQAELEQLLSDPKLLKAEIDARLKGLKQFKGLRQYYSRAAKDLAYFMATGLNRSPNLAKNSLAIAELYGTRQLGSVSAADSTAAQAALDPLISLLALSYSDGQTLNQLAQVFRVQNARGNESGMQLTLRMHRELQQQARERVFDGSEGLMLKGYVPEVFNPHITLKAANAQDGLQLQRQGYARSDKPLEQDKADPYAETMHLYRLEDGGLKAYVTGIFSTTGLHAKGNTVHGGEFDMQGQTLHAQNQRHTALIERKKASDVNAMFGTDDSYDPRRARDNHLAPVFNRNGQAVNFAYLMNHQTKDVMLERNNNFEDLLGKMAGSTFDKQASAAQNKQAVQAMHAQYLEEYARMPERYIKVGPTSPDASLREAYKLLPKATQQAIQDVWGSNTMLVRTDLADMYFGYRKFSLTDMFSKQANSGSDPAKEYRNAAEQVFVDFWSFILADRSTGSNPYLSADGRAAAEARAALKLRQAEDIWQEIISEIKDIVVVKTGLTLLGNVLSNFSELYWIGVPFKDMIKHHRVALRGVIAYRKDAKELFQLQNLLATGTLQGTLQDMQQRIIQLEDSIARSPVKELIDAGLLPTIVEDVGQNTDEFSYKSKLVRGTEKYTDGLNKHIKSAGKQLYIAHDTALYQWLSQGTQVSDFLARYTAYQYMTARTNAPMDHKTAVQFVADAFVNYDIPTHRSMQYLNDMGIIWFTKYYLRIQKVIMHLWRDNPSRALMLAGIDSYFAGAQTLMDSGFIHHIGNPLSVGAFKYPGALEDLATVNALMSPFKGQ